MNAMNLLKHWNLVFPSRSDRWTFRYKRRMVGQDIIRDNLRCQPKGKGNRAARRIGTMIQAQRDNRALLMWPDYLFPIQKI
jgi:hypothetical protein